MLKSSDKPEHLSYLLWRLVARNLIKREQDGTRVPPIFSLEQNNTTAI